MSRHLCAKRVHRAAARLPRIASQSWMIERSVLFLCQYYAFWFAEPAMDVNDPLGILRVEPLIHKLSCGGSIAEVNRFALQAHVFVRHLQGMSQLLITDLRLRATRSPILPA